MPGLSGGSRCTLAGCRGGKTSFGAGQKVALGAPQSPEGMKYSALTSSISLESPALLRQHRGDQPLHFHAVFTLKPKDGTAVAIVLRSSSLGVRAGRAAAFASSAVPSLHQLRIGRVLKPLCYGLSSRLCSEQGACP